MNIAFFYNLNFGGAKRVVYEQVKGLSEKHAVDIYKLDDEDDAFDPFRFARNVYKFSFSEKKSSNFISRFSSDLRTVINLKSLHKNIARQIDDNNYDVVLVHPDKLTQSPYVLKYLKTTSAYYCQEPLRMVYEYSLRLRENVVFPKRIYEEGNRFIRKINDRENVRSSKHTIASCLHVRERMIESYDVYPQVSYPGIDIDIFKPLKLKKKKQILFVGGKKVVTDGYDLVEAALQLIPRPLRPTIKIVAWKKKNKDRILDSELVKMYNESLAVICPSRLETFGLVPLEAMACGVPIIATNISGHRETILHNKTGYLTEFDPSQIAYFIQKLLNPKISTDIGRRGVAHITKHWTWKKRISELDTILKGYGDER